MGKGNRWFQAPIVASLAGALLSSRGISGLDLDGGRMVAKQ